MKLTRLALLLTVVGAITAACGDDAPTAPPIDPFVGTWDATAATLAPNADPTNPLDLIGLGSVITLEVTAAERYTFISANPILGTDTITGDISITGTSTFTLTNDDDPGDPLAGTYSLTNSDNTLAVVLPDAEIADFNMDGVNDPATLVAAFTKQ